MKQLMIWILVYTGMLMVAYLAPVPGSDWVHHWAPRFEIAAYPPWVEVLLAILPDLPFLTALSLTSLVYCLWVRRATPWQILAAFSSMAFFWPVWLGQIDAVPMLGLALLPWGIPLVLMKPQVAIWYTWVWWLKQKNRWRIALGSLAFLALTFAIWGWWPAKMTAPVTFESNYDLSAWRIHWLLGAVLAVAALLQSDPDRAMALGALAAPYIQGASYIVLLPALARLKGWRLFLVWLASWAGGLTVIWGDPARRLAMLFPISLWLAIYWQSMRTIPEGNSVIARKVETDAHP